MGVGIGRGKILLVGGYTVLEHPNRALVLSVDNAKIHVVSRPSKTWEVTSSYGKWSGENIHEMPEKLRFVKHAITESEVSEPHRIQIQEHGLFATGEKLGLGSSAAVTVAVIRSLRNDLMHKEIFKRAYRAHSNAQGKIGSGFDVASAVYGHIMYSRPTAPSGEGAKILPIAVPWGLVIRMFNVVGKSTGTAVSAKKVMQAVKSDRMARKVFDELAEENNRTTELFTRGQLKEFLDSLKRINALRRELGERSGVPIEPRDLDPVRRRLEKMGYITVLPGAGGYDSIVALGIRGEVSRKKIELPGIKEVEVWLR